MNVPSSKSGFTFIELAIVLAIMVILLGVATINLSSLQNRTNFSSSQNTLISDLKQQQLKAMVGDTDGRAGATSSSSYGIHFDTISYTLFYGSSYNSGDTTHNITIALDPNMSFPTSGISLPNNNSVIFDQVSGEFNGYGAISRKVTLLNSTNNEQKTIYFNRYGVITQVN